MVPVFGVPSTRDLDIPPFPLALAVLGLLEAGPLHPYGIQRLIKQWGKDQVVNVGQRAGLYRTIARLEDAGLIAVGSTERDERYPERTTYRLTDAGRAAARQWMAEILSTPRNEYPEFPAALSFLPVLTPGPPGTCCTSGATASPGASPNSMPNSVPEPEPEPDATPNSVPDTTVKPPGRPRAGPSRGSP